MDALDFVASVKKLFGSENPWITALAVLFLAIIITIGAILWAWHKGEAKKEKPYPFHF